MTTAGLAMSQNQITRGGGPTISTPGKKKVKKQRHTASAAHSNTPAVEHRHVPDKDFIISLPDIEMVYVDGGTYTMGLAERDAYPYEKPLHKVSLTEGFYIGKYEVTQRLWTAVMGDNPSVFEGDDLPVDNVDFEEVQEFIRCLNAITGKHYRLPTEAEWEYAARGGKKSKGYLYSGSNDINDVGWWKGNSGNMTHAVGKKKPNELGLYDMSGNVYEWCSDWYTAYKPGNFTNSTGAESGEQRTARGGSWWDENRRTRSGSRSCYDPESTNHTFGLRLVLDKK